MAVKHFSVTSQLPTGAAKARKLIITSFAPALGREGFQIMSQSETVIVLEKVSRSALTWFVTILLFPIGLIAFFVGKRSYNVTVIISPVNAALTDIVVSGVATDRTVSLVEDAFAV